MPDGLKQIKKGIQEIYRRNGNNTSIIIITVII